MANFQWIFSRRAAEVAARRSRNQKPRNPQKMALHKNPREIEAGLTPFLLVPFVPLLRIRKIFKNTSNCCYLRLLAATCHPFAQKSLSRQESWRWPKPPGGTAIQSHPTPLFFVPFVLSRPFHKFTATAMSATIQRLTLFSTLSTLFSALHPTDYSTQPIAPAPVATKSDGAAISKTFQLLTLF
jgi:hypothetical protein